VHGRYFRDSSEARSAATILRKCAFSVGAYFVIVVLVSLVSPRRVLHTGDPRCYDDWCMAVESVKPVILKGCIAYIANLRLFSRARRVSQRENNLVVYLTDSRGRRYDPVPDRSAIPLNVRLGPEESIETTRTFEAPADAKGLGVVIAHEGGFPPMNWLIVGEEAWFRKPAIVAYHP